MIDKIMATLGLIFVGVPVLILGGMCVLIGFIVYLSGCVIEALWRE